MRNSDFRGRVNGDGPRVRNHNSDPQQYRPRARPQYEINQEWRAWTEIALRCAGLPTTTNIQELYEMFSPRGNVTSIEILSDARRASSGIALINFCPPPPEPFWDKLDVTTLPSEWQDFRIKLEEPRRNFTSESPVKQGKFYDEHLKLGPKSLDFGTLIGKEKFMVMQTTGTDVGFLLNLVRSEIVILFTVAIPTTESSGIATYPQQQQHLSQYKFIIPLKRLKIVWEVDAGDTDHTLSLIFNVENPPSIYRRLEHIGPTLGGRTVWKEWSTWMRQTDITSDTQRQSMKNRAITLRKRDTVIDIGRWTTYRLMFHKPNLHSDTYHQIRAVLSDYNINFATRQSFEITERQSESIWDIIDRPQRSAASTGLAFLAEMSTVFMHLPWKLRYQLEACISQGCLSEHAVNKDFLEALLNMNEVKSLALLEFALEQKRAFYNPMDILSLQVPYITALSRKLPKHCSVSRTATITPSTLYYSSPTMDMSNRILRQYKEHEDRFLRVRFTEEKTEGRINWKEDNTQNAVFTRVYRCLLNGIQIGDRHYEFLAMGNSQFREHGAYFYASTSSLTAADIRQQMGAFDDILVVAKWASRLGQCFSATRAIRGTKVKIVEIQDVKREAPINESTTYTYNFTDGVGKISRFVAQIIGNELGHVNALNDPPSAFQVRMGGTKGVLAISPDAVGNEVHIRESQYKFPAIHQGLEVIQCASFTHVVLNRQLLSVLTYLGIPSGVFMTKLQLELTELEAAMHDQELAVRKLQERIDVNQTSLTVAGIILDGFMASQDPFAMSILHLWKAWVTRALKEKAGISIKEGAFVLGCTDETQTLVGHFDAAQETTYTTLEERIGALPQIFIQIDPLRQGKYRVIEGLCIVARNPSLHPGDIRVVNAVDKPGLRHLKNVVVFPQNGDRDIPSMCSGGDLDGDDFVVIWDPELIPEVAKWNIRPMDMDAPKQDTLDRPVTIKDVIPFFVNYMKNDSLRTIATSHLAIADYDPEGVASSRCLQLAALHSIAVDYPKSGKAAIMPLHLKPKRRPHFMVSGNRRAKDRCYHSNTILGKLFDAVKEVDFVPLVDAPFDERVLKAFPRNIEHLQAASRMKAEYDAAMRRIMAQHEITTEFEVYTTFVLSHARISNDYMFPQDLGRIVGALQERFKESVYELCGGREFNLTAPFIAAMYQTTADDVAMTLQSDRMEKMSMTTESNPIPNRAAKDLPLLSFPWLFHRELGMIARGQLNASVQTQAVLAQPTVRAHAAKTDVMVDVTPGQDDVETTEGIKHRGEVLQMFQDHDHGATRNGDIRGDYADDRSGDTSADIVMVDDAIGRVADGSEHFEYQMVEDGSEDGEIEEIVGMDDDMDSGMDRAMRMIE